ncbi:PREDICTED: olfactory receptor 10A4-like [Branchiostoma belcheri]|uniref:Olfactory receptor 10A4-like n=1 Tax=Branchiostoma belcheri TaxID=7741 RepID=A0A6P5AIH0_BRABE|nr:PREDICTED: olfactory receptor 10A4-like [Branchiostoma belcheri]
MEEETDGSLVEDGINQVLSLSSTSRDLQTAYFIISLVLSVGCGLLLIFLVWKKEYLQKPSHYLRCNLVVDDIVFTGCLIPVRVYALFRQDVSGQHLWCSARALVAPACGMSMLGTYLMVAIDLYYFVCDPLHYHDKVTTKRVLVGIFTTRALSLFFGFALAPMAFGGPPKYGVICDYGLGNSFSFHDIFKNTYLIILVLTALSIPVLYCRVFKEARRQQERDENRHLWVFQTKAFKTMVPHATVLTVTVATSVFQVATLRALTSKEQMPPRALVVAESVVILMFLTLSSMANPVVYSFRLPEFRRAFRELCGRPNNQLPAAVTGTGQGRLGRRQQDRVEMTAITGTSQGGPPIAGQQHQDSAGMVDITGSGQVASARQQQHSVRLDTITGVPGQVESAQRHQDSSALEMLAVTGSGQGASATVSTPAQMSTEGLKTTAEDDQAHNKQTRKVDMSAGTESCATTSELSAARRKLAWQESAIKSGNKL